mmetsp:Transcript_6377/g.9543  ORF Transcript_6377/g.9543 Transcript_6377/m.9543 type:complete len:219 (+) Transcript_6377:1570-2226(+)
MDRIFSGERSRNMLINGKKGVKLLRKTLQTCRRMLCLVVVMACRKNCSFDRLHSSMVFRIAYCSLEATPSLLLDPSMNVLCLSSQSKSPSMVSWTPLQKPSASAAIFAFWLDTAVVACSCFHSSGEMFFTSRGSFSCSELRTATAAASKGAKILPTSERSAPFKMSWMVFSGLFKISSCSAETVYPLTNRLTTFCKSLRFCHVVSNVPLLSSMRCKLA